MEVYTNSQEFNCATCKWGRHCDDDYSREKSNGPANYPKFIIKSGNERIESRVCFLPKITQKTQQLIKLYKHYCAGHLLNAGGVSEQPAAYLHAMQTLGDIWPQNQSM